MPRLAPPCKVALAARVPVAERSSADRHADCRAKGRGHRISSLLENLVRVSMEKRRRRESPVRACQLTESRDAVLVRHQQAVASSERAVHMATEASNGNLHLHREMLTLNQAPNHYLLSLTTLETHRSRDCREQTLLWRPAHYLHIPIPSTFAPVKRTAGMADT